MKEIYLSEYSYDRSIYGRKNNRSDDLLLFRVLKKVMVFCHQINMEDENENVQLGKLLDENSYKRDDKHIEIDGIINIDFIHEKMNFMR